MISATCPASADVAGDQADEPVDGRITPSVDAVARLAQALDVSLDYFVFDDHPRRPLHALADRLTALAELDDNDRQSLLSVLDALLTRTRVRALANDAS